MKPPETLKEEISKKCERVAVTQLLFGKVLQAKTIRNPQVSFLHCVSEMYHMFFGFFFYYGLQELC